MLPQHIHIFLMSHTQRIAGSTSSFHFSSIPASSSSSSSSASSIHGWLNQRMFISIILIYDRTAISFFRFLFFSPLLLQHLPPLRLLICILFLFLCLSFACCLNKSNQHDSQKLCNSSKLISSRKTRQRSLKIPVENV